MSKLSPSEWFRVKIGSCVSHFNILLILLTETTSQDSVLKSQHLKRKQNWSGLEPSLSGYQPSALPLSQTGSTFLFFCFDVVFIEGVLETPSPSTWDKRRSGSGMTNQKKERQLLSQAKLEPATSRYPAHAANALHHLLFIFSWQCAADRTLKSLTLSYRTLKSLTLSYRTLKSLTLSYRTLKSLTLSYRTLKALTLSYRTLKALTLSFIEVLFRICISAPDFCLSLAYSTIKSCILILTSTVAALTIYPCPLWINHKWIWINHNHRGNNCRH